MSRFMLHASPLTFLWLFAFICGLFFINEWQLQLFGLSVVSLFLWAIMSLSKGIDQGMSYSKSPVFIILAVYWIFCFLSIFWSAVPFVSVLSFGLFSILPLTFFIFVLRGGDDDFRIAAWAIGIVYAGLSLWALAQYYVFPAQYGGQAHHPLADTSSLSALFNLGFFVAVGFALTVQKKFLKYGLFLLAVLLFAGVTATGSRGGMLALGITAIIFCLLNFSVLAKSWRGGAVFIVLCAVALFLTQLSDFNHEEIINRFSRTLDSSDATGFTNNRNNIWTGTWALIREHWILGSGLGTFFLLYPAYRIPGDTGGTFMVHSDPLQLWAELGLMGPIFFYAVCIAVVVRTFRALKKLSRASADYIRIIAVFCGMACVIAHTHIAFHLYIVSTMFVFGILLAWWFKKTGEVIGEDNSVIEWPASFPVTIRQGIVILPLVLFACVFGSYILSEHYVEKAKRHAFDMDLESFTRLINLSDTLAMQQNYSPYLQAVTVPISILEVERKNIPEEEKKKIVQQIWGYLDRAEKLNPLAPSIPYYRAYTQKLVDKSALPEGTPSVEDYLLQALKHNPLHLGSRMELARYYKWSEETDKIGPLLEDGLKWTYNSDMGISFYLMAQTFYLEQGDVTRALQVEQKRNQLAKNLARKKEQSTQKSSLFGKSEQD